MDAASLDAEQETQDAESQSLLRARLPAGGAVRAAEESVSSESEAREPFASFIEIKIGRLRCKEQTPICFAAGVGIRRFHILSKIRLPC